MDLGWLCQAVVCAAVHPLWLWLRLIVMLSDSNMNDAKALSLLIWHSEKAMKGAENHCDFNGPFR